MDEMVVNDMILEDDDPFEGLSLMIQN